jgi:hypothetical protein
MTTELPLIDNKSILTPKQRTGLEVVWERTLA